MNEKEDIATKAKRVQTRLRNQIADTTKPNEFPIVNTRTVRASPDVNVTAHGVASKGKREIHVKQR